MMKTIVDWLLTHGSEFLWWALTGLVAFATKWVVTNVKNQTAQAVLNRVLHEVETSVLAVGQTYVKNLREANEDGTLTAIEKETAKAHALALAKENLGAAGVKKLTKVLGVEDTNKWLSSKIETAVSLAKAGKLVP